MADTALQRLTPRQRECVALAGLGLHNRQIAAALGVSVGTVKKYMRGAFEALGARNRTAAVMALLRLERGR